MTTAAPRHCRRICKISQTQLRHFGVKATYNGNVESEVRIHEYLPTVMDHVSFDYTTLTNAAHTWAQKACNIW